MADPNPVIMKQFDHCKEIPEPSAEQLALGRLDTVKLATAVE